MEGTLKINNVFGITPTTNCIAAGLDFYIPNIKNQITPKQAFEIFSKSFGHTPAELEEICDKLIFYVTASYGEEYADGNELNLLHLYLSITSSNLSGAKDPYGRFVDDYLIFDKKTPGIKVEVDDLVKINSGIKVKLDPGTAGIFFNKSGRGTKGWDVRAQVVDEDYTGFVHCSVGFTSSVYGAGKIYCGDKLTQMVILPVVHPTIVELNADEYADATSESKRGNNGFGSSDEKH